MSLSANASFWMRPLAKAVRHVLPAPLGWHTRCMIASYSRHTFLVMTAILVIALSIDLTFYLSKVLAAAPDWQDAWAAIYVAWYLALRSVDFIAELLPLACFFGVFWSEIVHTTSRERLVVWLSGRAAQQCLVPVLLFGTMVGIAELALNVYLRPLAVMTQVEAHLGSYGERFDQRPSSRPQWIASGRNLIQAFVVPGSPPTLRDVQVYQMDVTLSLQSLYRAKLAKPLDDKSWMLIDGTRWTPQTGAGPAQPNEAKRDPVETEQGVPFAQQKLDLNIAPIWVDNYRIAPRYLTNGIFRALTKVKFSPDSEFRTWRQARYALALFCAVMPLLAAALSVLLLAHEIRLVPLCFVVLAGYAANTVMKLFVVLGEHAYISPAAAGWSVPVFLLLACTAAVLMGRKIDTAGTRLSQMARPARV